jgi:E3 ubiquitin-protein ligase DOA10
VHIVHVNEMLRAQTTHGLSYLLSLILLPLNFCLNYSGPTKSEALEFIFSASFTARSYHPAFFALLISARYT